MGRARITFKRIANERSRRTTFLQRKRGLMKKMSEFSSKCGGGHCLIVYDDGNGDAGPVTWPQNPEEVYAVIHNYYVFRSKKERPRNTYGIEDFIENRKNMIEAEISRVNKQINSIKYPTWDPSIRNMEEEQLTDFCTHVDAKIKACDQRINLLKSKPHHGEANCSFLQDMIQASTTSSHPNLPNFMMQNLSEGQIIPTAIQALQNGKVDFTNSNNGGDGVCNQEINDMLRNMQQSGGDDDACFSFVPNISQKNASATTSLSNTISQNQPLLEDFTQLTNFDWSCLFRDDPMCSTSEPHESFFRSFYAEYQNEQQAGGALHGFQPPLDGFQSDF
ncbi:unnamed protein product [Sphenostylis stenocarpa]|uniref:MADS-box domain-containing protein n=1 Tax=Sphenostylis stenocarpa TaxID=92480 RepID=A0AA86VY27_9FABA|nr:unnamed protein product [Sphenostylis stenocarpa]